MEELLEINLKPKNKFQVGDKVRISYGSIYEVGEVRKYVPKGMYIVDFNASGAWKDSYSGTFLERHLEKV